MAMHSSNPRARPKVSLRKRKIRPRANAHLLHLQRVQIYDRNARILKSIDSLEGRILKKFESGTGLSKEEAQETENEVAQIRHEVNFFFPKTIELESSRFISQSEGAKLRHDVNNRLMDAVSIPLSIEDEFRGTFSPEWVKKMKMFIETVREMSGKQIPRQRGKGQFKVGTKKLIPKPRKLVSGRHS